MFPGLFWNSLSRDLSFWVGTSHDWGLLGGLESLGLRERIEDELVGGRGASEVLF